MKAGIAAALALAAALGSGQVLADGNELLRQCQHTIKAAEMEKSFDRFQAGMCLGMVQGVQSTVYFLSDDLNNDSKFCVPTKVSIGQLVRIVVKYLKDNPKLLNESETGLIWLALKDAYPCK
jgi:hypothetical protein